MFELIYSSSLTTVVFTGMCRQSKNFPMTLLLTVVDCWLRAADWEMASAQFLCTMGSSFCLLQFSPRTPGCILTSMMYFPSRKVLTLSTLPHSEMGHFMGKCSHLAQISLGDSLQQILNVGAEVVDVDGQGASGSLHDDSAALTGGIETHWDSDQLKELISFLFGPSVF